MSNLKFLNPRDGDMLSNVSGNLRNGELEIEVSLSGTESCPIWVNGTQARWQGDHYTVNIALTAYKNTLTARDADGAEETIVIYWLKNAANKYSVSVDDNILFLADITLNQDKYQSIFDNPYLSIYKRAHDLYGAKVRLNLFYKTEEKHSIGVCGDFDLSMMTDKFKEEFQANSHWLHFGFHALAVLPSWTYTNATGETLTHDYELIAKEVNRFAGEGMLENVTTNHWCSGNREVVRAERKQGVYALMAYLQIRDGKPWVSYYLDNEQIAHANEYGFWKDHSEDMIFGKIDVVMNALTCQEIREKLDESKSRYPKKGAVEIMIHEQFFYPDYPLYLPDFEQRVLTGCQWCVENGYTPAFACEMLEEC